MWLLSSLLGCATVGTFQSARPIDAGTVQVGLESSLVSSRTPDSGHESTTPIALALRYGLDPRTQIGVRVGAVAPEVAVTRRLIGDGDDDLAVSIAPSLGGWRVATHGIPMVFVYGQLPLLIGVPTGRGSELVFGPTASFEWGHHLALPVWGG
ncbi:MAG: hypothetical protein ABMB14_10910, partial [Myxococcota bacterium]